MKAYIFTKYESDERKLILEKKVIISDLSRFEIMKLTKNGSYDWEECDVEFQPERLNPEERNLAEDLGILKIEASPISMDYFTLCDSLTSTNK